ncbi:pyridoxamine 5'-phosphate oxidase family protein [Thioalkalivibrio sp. HK1]|uniref:pyridoxamine 5'-phosphate oxidase family protein n=1 Tax=Thioalkalivibrio sp. HK1 TaxID=1469245 RepID=UPI00046F4EE1|nr:pyridoxamine 5'-phosphate oxidase family protein [Thioalkalivibrio sp. HK1]
MLSDAERRFVESMPVARLATVGAGGMPHLVPICHGLIGGNIYTTVDRKPKRFLSANSAAAIDITPKTPERFPLGRLRNIAHHPQAAILVDRYDEDWSQLAWVMLRGRAEILEAGDEHDLAQNLLCRRYPRYRSMSIEELPVIALRIDRVNSWGAIDASKPSFEA